jgi:hypothetical protein
MCEFAANAQFSVTTQASPFFTYTGFQPRMSFDPPTPIGSASARKTNERAQAEQFADHMKEVWELLRDEMSLAQTRMEGYANESRKPAPNYRVNDKVWLSTKNLRTERPSKKLDHKQVGPFKILEKIGQAAYRLDLPASMKCHDVFHTSLLRLDPDNPLPGQTSEPPLPVIVDGEEEYIVERILDSRFYYGRLQYKVYWEGHPPDNT